MSVGRVRLKAIKDALKECLPGCDWRKGEHHWHVYPPKGQPPFYLSKGKHGKGMRAEIERGEIKAMARQFGVLTAMRKHIPSL